jgi:cell division protein FtsW
VNGGARRSSSRSTLVARSQAGSSNTDGRRHNPDYWILILTSLLLTIGLIVVYSISPGLAASQHISQSYFITKQLLAVGLGLVTFVTAAFIPLSLWRRLAIPLVAIALLGCYGNSY